MSYYYWRPNSSFQFHVSQITNFRGHTTFARKIHALSICYSKYEFFPTLSIFRLAVCALPFGFTVMKVLDNTTEPYASVNSHPLGEQPRICLRLYPRGGEFEILLFPGGNNKIFPAKKKKTFRPIKGIFSQTWILRESGKQIELRGIVLACFCHQYSYFIHEKFRA